ncbi:hypothetical protein F1559_004470 [Cyanidiococcus yangmingshanensis]|uniref:Uncharacterized protein n=1 Tax=Cyanidiococcus yangmingshanensis TaxID=2690220 RepID=A0A7J7IKR1_9RHOD|nr:hypothetical protein F1559_004470 [Cyanidiococcus yangmingshanensis]
MLQWSQRQRRLFLLCFGSVILLFLWMRARERSKGVQVEDLVLVRRTQRPLYLFIAGIEGAGHNTVRELLKPCATAEIKDPGFHLDGGEEPEHRYAKFFAESLELSLRDRRVLSVRSRNVVILDALSTFPIGPEREPTRRPDLEVLLDLHRKGVVELRVLVLWREPLRCVQYAASRSKARDPLLVARVVEESLLYLSKQIEHMPTELWTIMNYDDFVANPSKFDSTIASLLPETARCSSRKLDPERVRELHRIYEHQTLSMNELGERECRLPDNLCGNLENALSEFLDKRAFMWAPLAEFAAS